MRKSQENKLKMDRKNALGSGLPPSMQDFQDIIKNLQN